jgi:hypothetical protein
LTTVVPEVAETDVAVPSEGWMSMDGGDMMMLQRC